MFVININIHDSGYYKYIYNNHKKSNLTDLLLFSFQVDYYFAFVISIDSIMSCRLLTLKARHFILSLQYSDTHLVAYNNICDFIFTNAKFLCVTFIH